MTRFWRVMIIAYVLIYSFLVPVLSEVIHDPSRPLVVARLLSRLLHTLLFLYPIIAYRRGFGWLHPLVFTVVWELAIGVGVSPESLLKSLQVFVQPLHATLSSPGLVGFSEREVAVQVVKTRLIESLALVAYYVGFFSKLRPRVPALNVRPRRGVGGRALLIVAGVFGVYLFVMEMRGGILNHMASFGLGRFRVLSGLQHIMVFLQFAVLACLLWYATNREAEKNPLFWGAFGLSLFMLFTWSGSRSDVVLPMIFLVFIRMFHTHSIPWVQVLAVGTAGFILVILLGALRQSTYGGRGPDLEILTEFQFGKSIEIVEKSQASRGVGTLPAIIGRVPHEVDFLYGHTYIGALLNFVPRAIWEDKPRGTGPYVTKYLYGTRGTVKIADSGPEVGGNPSGPTGALYWNFYIPGVVVGWFLVGIIHFWIAQFLRKNPSSVFIPLYLTCILMGPSPGSIISGSRELIIILFLMYVMKLMSKK